ncbi:MAG: hypothetical protein MK080_12125 [Opitutales bacterium]|nr:hypothetical protein [Opitutales bacterium]NRA27907.1 hypothetical protein [Opitutales bacterium]
MIGHLLHFEEYRGKVLRQVWLSHEGLKTTFFRLSQKSSTPPPPLLATCDITYDHPKKNPEDSPFIREWQLVTDRSAIAKPWKRLQASCYFATFLRLNASHFPDPADVFEYTETVLDAFHMHPHFSAVLLKGITRLLRAEGFPVIEAWLPRQPQLILDSMTTLLRHAIAEPQIAELDDKLLSSCWHSLRSWIEHDTDFLLPSGTAI